MSVVRVVLADDHEVVREGLKALINSQPDMEVVGDASDGYGAIECAVRLKPHVIVMDISMPGMNGLEAIAELRRRTPAANVLALTRHHESGYLQQVLKTGASGYVLKRSRAAEVLRSIRIVADGGTYVDPLIAAEIIDDHRSGGRGQAASGLSGREEQVLRLLALGYSNKEAAVRLAVSVKTIETHKMNAMRKLGLIDRVALVEFASLQGWIRAT